MMTEKPIRTLEAGREVGILLGLSPTLGPSEQVPPCSLSMKNT